MPLERAIHKLTGEPAARLRARPTAACVEVGKAADLVVFDPDTVAPGPLRRIRDFPADGERLTADAPVGMTHTLVNGVPIRVDGAAGRQASARPPGRRPPLVSADESRDGVSLTNLDQPLFDGADATKRDLVEYLDAVRDRIIPVLEDRPLSVIRVHRGQEAFMQKNVPKYTPPWVRTVTVLGGDLEAGRVLRAVQRPPHAALVREPARGGVPPDPRAGRPSRPHDPSRARPRPARRRRVLDGRPGRPPGPPARWPTSGWKARSRPAGPRACTSSSRSTTRRRRRTRPPRRAPSRRGPSASIPTIATTAFMKEDRGGKVFVDSTRVGGATVIAAYSPRVRPGVPVSFPVRWDDLDDVAPADFTVHTALEHLGDGDPWAAQMPAPQRLSAELIEEGHAIPVARVQAMHEGKRRARSRRS